MRPQRERLQDLKERVARIVATDATSPQYLYEPVVLALVELSAYLYDLDHGCALERDAMALIERTEQRLAALRSHSALKHARRHYAA